MGAAAAELRQLLDQIGTRHANATTVLDRRFIEIRNLRPDLGRIASDYARLIGACFTEEYAFEAAALFNPSIIAHPSQHDVAPGGLRFILSLRAVGEGHVSSIIFRTGYIAPDGGLRIDPPAPNPRSARAEPIRGTSPTKPGIRLICDDDHQLSSVVLFPTCKAHRRGLEDLRMVDFVDDDGQHSCIGTITGVGTESVRQELLHTNDFRSFDLTPIAGPYAATKGMVLFPRRIGGRYAMLGRVDHDSLWLLSSDNLYQWDGGVRVISPAEPQEMVQIGNCAAPIELPQGWLVLTHGVGPMRSYTVGACLLDRDDPTRLIARLERPLLSPGTRQWAGYVPNTVYSCGGLVHAGTLYLPFGVADSFACIARVNVSSLLSAMVRC
ncbi:MAG: glycoside hydrolase family 130 protein [Candidatus Sphingomonas colombiensis]|nr:glycoside hydrolase family 130 protein [Sphingomonas sp.]WEK43214.1 MAG: glycoside hydrolase family 130 protein [Sphingomonas sp.]